MINRITLICGGDVHEYSVKQPNIILPHPPKYVKESEEASDTGEAAHVEWQGMLNGPLQREASV